MAFVERVRLRGTKQHQESSCVEVLDQSDLLISFILESNNL